jgi:hypothetical protein
LLSDDMFGGGASSCVTGTVVVLDVADADEVAFDVDVDDDATCADALLLNSVGVLGSVYAMARIQDQHHNTNNTSVAYAAVRHR